MQNEVSHTAMAHISAFTETKTKNICSVDNILNYDNFETHESDNLTPKFKVNLTCFYSKSNSLFFFCISLFYCPWFKINNICYGNSTCVAPNRKAVKQRVTYGARRKQFD
jgi:hypothetical protein